MILEVVRRRELKVTGRRSRDAVDRFLMRRAVLGAVWRVEGENVSAPIERRVVDLEPADSEDDGVVSELCDVEGEGFAV